jgi:transposase-like protein
VEVDRGSQHQHAQLGDVDWLHRRYLDDGASIRDLALEIGCSPARVRLALARAGIPIRPGGQPSKLSQLSRDDAVWLVEEYGITGAARHLKVSVQTFEVTVATLDIKDAITSAATVYDRRRRQAGPLWPPLLHDRDALAREYARKPASTIARELGISASTVTKALRRHGILTQPQARGPRPRTGTSNPAWPPLLRDVGALAREYATKPATRIARELGVSAGTVTKALNLHGIRTQPQPPGPRRPRHAADDLSR